MSDILSRRQFVKSTARAAVQAGAGTLLLSPAMLALAPRARAFDFVDLRRIIGAADGTIVLPADAAYATVKSGYSRRAAAAFSSEVPAAVVRAKTAAGVAAAVRWAADNRVQVNVRGGGHSYEGFSNGPELVIDLRDMAGFSMGGEIAAAGNNPRSRIAAIGGGAKLGVVNKQVCDAGYVLTTGSCPTVGIGGLATGGGHGHLTRRFGMTCDNIVSAQVVLADGRIVTASRDENRDLYWALRGGGGGTFGIVTRFDMRTYRLNACTRFSYKWKGSEALRVLRAWQSWGPNASWDLSHHMSLSGSPGALSVGASGVFLGDAAGFSREAASFLKDAGAPTERNIVKPTSYFETVTNFGGDPAKQGPVFFKAKSDYVNSPMSDAGLQALINSLKSVPVAASIMLDAYGDNGAQSARRYAEAHPGESAADTSFFHRHALYSIQYYKEGGSNLSSAEIAWFRQTQATMRPHVSGHAYVNYCDLDIRDWQNAYWGSNYPRLSDIKKQLDPGQVFTHRQGVGSENSGKYNADWSRRV